MDHSLDSLLLMAQIDRQRDQLRTAEEEVASLADKVKRQNGTDEDLRRIGEKERLAAGLRTPLSKAVSRLRTQDPEVFREWVEVNRQVLNGVILETLRRDRPGIESVDEGLRIIARDARYSNGDLDVLRLSGHLDEWTQLFASKRPYALNPPSWDVWVVTPPVTIELGNPLPIPADLATRHRDITSHPDWKAWHQGLIFFAGSLSVLDQGKPCNFTRETGSKSPSGEWQSSWVLSTGSLSLVSRWGERSGADSGNLESFSTVEVKGLLPGEKLDWDGSLGSDTAHLSVLFSGLREDRRRAMVALGRLLFGEVRISFPQAAHP